MSGPEKRVITKEVFSLEESLESLNSLESLEHGRILLYFTEFGDSLKSLEFSKFSRISRKWTFLKDPFSKKTLFFEPDNVLAKLTNIFGGWEWGPSLMVGTCVIIGP